ncbi:phage major capsid protein [Phascolarctobacterium faecium]|jgi:HK97 family phage major capsid protein|uniref:phage major capsid protein n=1 Tax=Phascolarctobacterium faecium TaxID=33025 RepID=UPI00206825BB|nr:phage major capsid protein [Phascolarctobacterium faecium]DAL51564.1 MAG TPA_asm: major capsid protein [Caudoviricetes sp.]
MNIKELRDKRLDVWNKAKAFLDDHRKDGVLSAEDDAVYARMEKELDDLAKEITRQEKLEAYEKEMAKNITTPLTTKPNNEVPVEEKKGRASDAYKKAMLDAMRCNFKRVSNVLQEGVDADGGYLVPEEYDKRIIDILSEENIMRKLGTTITTSGQHKINIAATKPAAAWIEEGGALQFSDATFSQILLDAHKLHVAIKITEELLYDNAFNLESYIVTEFGKAIANAEEDAFLNGDGTGKPLGLFAKTGGGTKAASTDAPTADDFIALIYALKRPYRKNASFIINDKNIALLRQLKDNNGVYMWQPSVQVGEPDTFLGYKLYTSQFAPTNAIAFGDYRYYNIGDRGTRSWQELRELFAGNGMIAYVAKERVDGKLILPEAVQILSITGKSTGSK